MWGGCGQEGHGVEPPDRSLMDFLFSHQKKFKAVLKALACDCCVDLPMYTNLSIIIIKRTAHFVYVHTHNNKWQ